MNSNINTEAQEYWPIVTADDKTLIFNRLMTTNGFKNEDFYYSTRDSLGGWSKALPLKTLNTEENEGAQTLSANGKFMIFTSCNHKDGYGSCDLFYSLKIGETWLPPRNLGSTINTKAWETQPALSADGTELYFVSNRAGGKGGMDIWHSKLLCIDQEGQMQWSAPTNLTINTPKSEMSPFIHSDNQTLYFSSNGYTQNPQFDIYLTRKKAGVFSTPENIGAPINTTADEVGFVVNTSGTTAYFSSDRQGDNKDIYSYSLPTCHRPQKVKILQGKVLNKINKQPLLASLSLQSLTDSTKRYHTLTDFENGSYLLCLTQGKEWRFSVQAEGFLFYSEKIDLRTKNLVSTHKDILLAPLEKGAKLTLNTIFFDTDKATLKPSSIMELEHIKQLLLENPTLKIELSGHTDNQGTNAYNQRLSKARALSIYKWLLAQGIAAVRLSAKGYGESLPIATNETETGRAQNRRTELKVTAH